MRCHTRDDLPGPAALWAGGRRCTTRPTCFAGRGRWLRDRAPRRSPAGRPATAAGRDSDPARGGRDYSLHCADMRSAHPT